MAWGNTQAEGKTTLETRNKGDRWAISARGSWGMGGRKMKCLNWGRCWVWGVGALSTTMLCPPMCAGDTYAVLDTQTLERRAQEHQVWGCDPFGCCCGFWTGWGQQHEAQEGQVGPLATITPAPPAGKSPGGAHGAAGHEPRQARRSMAPGLDQEWWQKTKRPILPQECQAILPDLVAPEEVSSLFSL